MGSFGMRIVRVLFTRFVEPIIWIVIDMNDLVAARNTTLR